MKKIYLLLSILLCFGFALSTEVHAQGGGPKLFEEGDELPATTQLKVTWEINDYLANSSGSIKTTNNYLLIYFNLEYGAFKDGWIKVNNQLVTYLSIPGPYEIIINTSSWNISQRTVTYNTTTDVILFYWEDLNAPTGYTITFNSNGGSSVTSISDVTELPDTLPIPTKENHTFLGWYYDSDFTNEAFAGDPLTGDVTLYAKWGEKNKMTDITILIIGLIIFIIANILGFIFKNNLLTALSGLLWLLPIFLVDNAIIKIFSIIIMLITFLFSFKERDDYYYD